MKSYIPMALTLSRLIVSPILIPYLSVNFLPKDYILVNLLVALIFILFSLTDFFDGYLARLFLSKSELGKILDPIADKFLLYSTIIALVNINKIYYFWAIIFIGREFYIMALRQIALSNGFDIAVSKLGKIKTFFQLIALTWIIINPYQHKLTILTIYFNQIEKYLLIIALLLTIISAIQYTIIFFNSYKIKTGNAFF